MPPVPRLRAARTARGWTVTAFAAALRISRQTVHAIEAGNYVPNTTLALHMARLLGSSVEELFGDPPPAARPAAAVRATLVGAAGAAHRAGTPMQAWTMGRRRLACPLPPHPAFLPVVDRLVRAHGRQRVSVAPAPGGARRRQLVVAGCDPGLSVLGRALDAQGLDVVLLPVPSRTAVEWLREGHVHVAGSHLRDRASGEYNLPMVRDLFGARPMRVATFAEREEGFVVAAGNPRRIRRAADLARRGVRIVNRQPGSGARHLLDERLADAGVPARAVEGYDQVVHGHLEAASAVAAGGADCCIATAAVAAWFGLDFVPLQAARFDLIFDPAPGPDAAGAAGAALLQALAGADLRRGLETLAGYDTTHTGDIVS